MGLRIVLVACALAASISSPVAAENLSIVCAGSGSALTEHSSYAVASNGFGGMAFGQAVTLGQTGYADQVSIEITDQGGRIRIPRALLPPIHGGSEGWFRMKKVNVTATEITASAAVNLVTNPKIRIDRRMGTLHIYGRMGTFTAQCQRIDPAARPAF